MIEPFRNYLTSKAAFTAAELEQMEAGATVKKLKRRDFLLRQGDVCRDMAFVVSGSLRLYRTDEQAQEHILRFAIENWWITDAESFRTGLPAKGAIDALEDTQVLLWSRETFERLKREVPAFNALESQLAGRNLDAQINRLYTSISHSAEERYEEFITAFPDFYQRIPLHMIASYLGVSRETLSRIRKQAGLH
ncbi:Crp/Fnr family transcriptional regulator [Hymenobacter cellulosilyticus]|uniref:Crp/Fnr family transcriptional regulator n=1 Tax=Hymenobacter cellulosilyticus TaxID=2932248 RepID=A0A8T9PZ64_9BACT|nr:Crp/Fnr family transcriptional regulator [Hymenobacter cellulosilyticus]UOQ70387.1 Crp/Fnr family transcriptional regulator [Hymenobacter cellulosilyticus]